ncbi:MAG: response regulator [Clostridiales bacterium]|nr:response regulator [Clostridiales bacterium]
MNLLIVDDETLIHVSVEYCLKELHADDITIFHAYNGADMLETMTTAFFDIVLVDIRMPGLNGLEAIRQAKQLYHDTAYYIMTGFSEFEYAREAVHLNVAEYLLKPLETEALKQIISRAREKVLLARSHIRDCLQNWLTAAIHNHNIAALFPEKYFISAILLTCDTLQPDAALRQPHFTETCPDSVLSFPCKEGLLFLLYSQNPNDIYTILGQFSQEILPPSCTAFLSSVCHEPDQLAGQIQSLLRLSPLRVLHGISKRYHYALFPEPDSEELLFSGLWIDLRDSLFQRQPEEYQSLYPRILQQLKEKPLTGSQMDHLSRFISSLTGRV